MMFVGDVGVNGAITQSGGSANQGAAVGNISSTRDEASLNAETVLDRTQSNAPEA